MILHFLWKQKDLGKFLETIFFIRKIEKLQKHTKYISLSLFLQIILKLLQLYKI